MWHGPGLAGEKPVSKLPDATKAVACRFAHFGVGCLIQAVSRRK